MAHVPGETGWQRASAGFHLVWLAERETLKHDRATGLLKAECQAVIINLNRFRSQAELCVLVRPIMAGGASYRSIGLPAMVPARSTCNVMQCNLLNRAMSPSLQSYARGRVSEVYTWYGL